MIENSDFVETDIPYDFQLPETHCLPEDKREEVRDWVLEWSMNQNVEQSLSTRTCEKCGVETYIAGLNCHACQAQSELCIITGWPVQSHLRMNVNHRSDLAANKDDWNKYLQHFQVDPWAGVLQTAGYLP